MQQPKKRYCAAYVAVVRVLSKLEDGEVLTSKTVFCNKDTFHLSRYANGENIWMLGQYIPP